MARKTIVLGSFVAIALVGSAAFVLRGGQPVERKKESLQKIALESIYGTNDQPGLQALDEISLKATFKRADKIGASNVLLVRAQAISSAMKMTSMIFSGAADLKMTQGIDLRSRPAEHWLVAYFGIAQSSPPAVLVQSVERQGKVIRFHYLRPKARGNDEKKIWYCFWAPVGELPNGEYSLELFDVSSRQVTFMRLMQVWNEK